jgi:competence protein ComEC
MLDGIEWKVLAPTYFDVVDAAATGNPNMASAIVHIAVEDRDFLVTGDSPFATWEALESDLPVGAIVRWPHHGGAIGNPVLGAQRRLFELLDPEMVVVSVGADNKYGHPSPSFFAAAKASATPFLCTEATPACVLGGGPGGRCAGSVRVELGQGSDPVLSVDAADHASVIDQYGQGQCR